MNNKNPFNQPVKARVTAIFDKEKRPYAVSLPINTPRISITFELKYWEGSELPKTGDEVTLNKIRHLKNKGYRAYQVSPAE